MNENKIEKRILTPKKRKKNNAFTLIELLAIIVILAVIAVITVPLILNMIEDSKLSQAKLSTEGYIDAARYKYSTDYLNQTVRENKPTYLTKELSTDGQKAQTGALKIQNSGKVRACNIHFDNGYYCNGTKGNVVCSRQESSNISACGQEPEVNEIWDGFITLELFYPENSTERMWMLKDDEGIRDSSNTWTYYTGPITIPYDRVEDIWLKYIIDGEEHHSTKGEPFVSIYEQHITDEGTLIRILYDDRASVKEYQIENEEWKNYTKKLLITEPTLISARVKVNDNVYDEDGELIRTEVLTNTDSYLVMPSVIFEFSESFELSFDLVEKVYAANAKELTLSVNNGKYKLKNIYYRIYKNGEDPNDYNFIEYKNPLIVEEGYKVDSYYTLDVDGKEYMSKITTKHNVANYNNEEENNDPEIKDTTIPEGEDYETVKPNTNNIGKNSINEAPIINVEYSSDNKSALVSLTTDNAYKKMMIKIDNEKFVEYTTPITLTKNTRVQAYYIDNEDYKSYRAYKDVSLIKIGSLPTLGFITEQKSDSVLVEIKSDSNNIEYSLDNINYQNYKNPLEITENKTIYAKACNDVGCTEKKYNITSFKKPTKVSNANNVNDNKGSYETPIKKEKLSISFDYNPKELSDSVEVTITFDPRSEFNSYRIGNGEIIEYTGTFTVNKNTRIYAYAKSTTGSGYEYINISNLNVDEECKSPIISIDPNNSSTNKVEVGIDYFKNSKTKQYSFNNSTLTTYENEFEINENGTILAHQVCNNDEIKESTYEITNIIQIPSYVFEYDDYYLLKFGTQLTETMKIEYNYNNTNWVPYKNDGIILIKPEAANKLKDQNGKFNIYIKDANGNEVLFNGDYFIMEGTFNEMKDRFQVRWIDIKPPSPIITISPETVAQEVTVNIDYIGNEIEQKLYQIVDENGVASSWATYNGEFKINHKGIIRARSINNKNIKSLVSEYIVNNIDTESPIIELTGIPTKEIRKFNLSINTKDGVGLKTLKYAYGEYDINYFKENGEIIYNLESQNIRSRINSLDISSNGKITFYVMDQAGNEKIEILDVNIIDDTLPLIMITPTYNDELNVNISIDYGDSVTKKYKIGNNSWIDYTDSFNLDSYTVLANKDKYLVDDKLIVYAKGIDSNKNEGIEEKEIIIDLDMPNAPIINGNLKENFYYDISIAYDNRADIINYYSIDNGETWIEYTNNFEYEGGTILAKSEKINGLKNIVSSTFKTYIKSKTLGGYNWHIIREYTENGTNYQTLLMDGGQLEKMKTCTNDKKSDTDCDTNGTYVIYSWDKSLIQTYLNTTFIDDLKSNGVNMDKIKTEFVCVDPSIGGIKNYSYGGYLKQEVEAVEGTCSKYKEYQVRLITTSEYFNLSYYFRNDELPYEGAISGGVIDGKVAKIDGIERLNETDSESWLYSESLGTWWSMSSVSSIYENRLSNARAIVAYGSIVEMGNTHNYDVRPVITIMK